MAAFGLILWQGGIALVIGSGYGFAVGLEMAALLVGEAWQSIQRHRAQRRPLSTA